MKKYIKAINHANKQTFGLSNIQILTIIIILTVYAVNVYVYGLPKF